MVQIGNIQLNDFPLLLAPMEDVSDPPFRAVCKENGADMLYTEFISVEGLIRDAEQSVQKLDIYPYERPIGIQIFGAELDSMLRAAEIVTAAGPELLDINFGCPVKKVTCKGAGAAILQDLPKMQRLSIRIQEVAQRLQDVGVQALSIHGRTRKQMYKGTADWEPIAAVKNNPNIHIPIFGNGDIDSPQKALQYRDRYGLDGMMIGRAAIGYPWIFREIKHFFATGECLPPPSLDERVDVCRRHFAFSIQWKGDKRGIFEMRRHYGQYFRGLHGFKSFRIQLVEAESPDIVFETLEAIRSHYSSGVEVLA